MKTEDPTLLIPKNKVALYLTKLKIKMQLILHFGKNFGKNCVTIIKVAHLVT